MRRSNFSIDAIVPMDSPVEPLERRPSKTKTLLGKGGGRGVGFQWKSPDDPALHLVLVDTNIDPDSICQTSAISGTVVLSYNSGQTDVADMVRLLGIACARNEAPFQTVSLVGPAATFPIKQLKQRIETDLDRDKLWPLAEALAGATATQPATLMGYDLQPVNHNYAFCLESFSTRLEIDLPRLYFQPEAFQGSFDPAYVWCKDQACLEKTGQTLKPLPFPRRESLGRPALRKVNTFG